MTSRDFVIWLKGFTEACNDYTATPKQWDRIKEVLDEVEDYDDNPGIDVEVDGWNDWYQKDPHSNKNLQYLSGSIKPGIAINFVSGSTGTSYATTIWNDQMGNWHYTNYPEGTGGYYHRPDNKKQQLND
jgi:hypothetical protein